MTQLATTTNKPTTDFLSRPLLASLNIDWEKAIYITFLVVAIVSRFADLGSRVMSHDESLHTQFSYQFYNGDGYQHTPLMHGPSLFHITAASYWLFGDSDLSARIPVAIVGILLVILVPYLLRPWIGRVGALFASFVLLISPYVTYYSRYIRHDIYVIATALMIFIAIWYYLRQPQDKYLWWFAIGMGLMFTTMETAFIYVAVFGSFLILRFLPRVVVSPWFRRNLPELRLPLLVVLAAVLLVGVGFVGQHLLAEQAQAVVTPEATQGFAADPSQEEVAVVTAQSSGAETIMRWLQIGGIAVLSLGLFLAARTMRPHVDRYPEFDLIILFTTLVLPAASPFLTRIAGWSPRDYSFSACILPGQETMTPLQIFLGRLGNSTCWNAFFDSGLVHSGIFLILTLAAAVLVGLWWDRRRWLIAAAIFHGIFLVLFTSFFTNPSGWASGMIGSLGYWLEQHGVQRGSQPLYYYTFVLPFYEFLAVAFSLVAIRFWLVQRRVNQIVSYWVTLLLVSLLAFSLARWLYSRYYVVAGEENRGVLLAGLLAGLLVFGLGMLYWFFVRRRQLLDQYELNRNFRSLFKLEMVCDFVPFLAWWLLLTWVIYSIAGEKMPWLSLHFVTPMALLVGWYFNERFQAVAPGSFLARRTLLIVGLTMAVIVAVLLALAPLLLGQIQFGSQQAANLANLGRFLGSLLVAGAVLYFWQQLYQQEERPVRQLALVLGVFGLLSLLTIRFTYMASFPNADYTTEFMVYAHGAPATKSVVLNQVEELSLRLHGDHSIRVAYDNDVSWPYTWYLRNYPNRHYFGENPSQALNESPVIIVGRRNWDQVEPYLGNNYEARTYIFLWWPMEEYRRFSWNAVFGDPTRPDQRGLGDARVRQALWDIFFYRDYQRYGEVFGGAYTASEWPLRHELRLYIRKDVLAALWDHGVGAIVAAEGLQDPYAENDFMLSPALILNESGIPGAAEGQLFSPRNVAVGPDGLIYVVDSGNRRIQVFDQDGRFVRAWGTQGGEPGQFNDESWGIAVDETHVYVADTWNHRIQIFTHTGQLVTAFGRNGSPLSEEDPGLGLFYGPRSIVRLEDGQLLVTDTGNHRMQLMDQNGNFLSQIGRFGNQLGQLNEPVGLATAPDGSIYVADTWNGRIQQFAPDLFPLRQWIVHAWAGQSVNNKPYLAVDSAGRVYATDPEGYRVLIFSANGDYLGRFGSFGAGSNNFGLPNGIAVDSQNNVYVADAGNHRVLKFAPIFGPPPAEDLPGLGDDPDAEVIPGDDLEEERPLEDPEGEGPIEDEDETGTIPTPTVAGNE